MTTYRPPPTIVGSAGVVGHRHQSDVVDEVDVEEIVRLLLRKLASDPEEATVKRPRTESRNRRLHAFAILGTLRADLDRAPVSQGLGRRIVGEIRHDRRRVVMRRHIFLGLALQRTMREP